MVVCVCACVPACVHVCMFVCTCVRACVRACMCVLVKTHNPSLLLPKSFPSNESLSPLQPPPSPSCSSVLTVKMACATAALSTTSGRRCRTRRVPRTSPQSGSPPSPSLTTIECTSQVFLGLGWACSRGHLFPVGLAWAPTAVSARCSTVESAHTTTCATPGR